MSYEYSQELMNDYEKLLEIDKGYDVIIYAGEDEVEIHAHSLILCIRSQYFYAAFSNKWANKKDGKFVLNKPNISPQILNIILRFIYCGKIDLTKLQGQEILNLLIAVDELNVQTLIQSIQDYLINYQYDFLQQNSIEIVLTAYQYENFTDLWNYCLYKICEKPDVLFNSDKFINLKEPLLESLLERDYFFSDEVVIWDNLIKWSFSQHPSIQKDIKKLNKEEIMIMERTLHRFIPLIRFYNITSEDFFFKVYPFKALVSEDMIDNLLAFHMNSNKKLDIDTRPLRYPKYNSIIINSIHFTLLSSWIEKKNEPPYNECNIPYNFNLLYRASRDGNTAVAFHTKCDNKGATIVVVKVQNSEQILGGYNPLQWDSSNKWKQTRDSFLFSFKNRNDLNSGKVGHINADYDYALYCCQNYGPAFGSGHDLFQDNDGNWKSYNSCSYPKIDMPKSFKIGGLNYDVFNVEDYEVFQVI
ncbi:unnamed protein product [Rhizophagus irregularis]|uniref:BTB-domain-containing protein n=1 Tax=Rhizophagus irregularis TaxID=588596 RepID=A0A2N1NK71_9GLOM|nr:BTB-domain-containing protein [Rhizophagus irregularis]CAB4377961.1 unnamed protein product [Rhizophagus irregularis]